MSILKNPTCVCETREKLESACRDLLRERDRLREQVAKLDAKLGLTPCRENRCVRFAELRALLTRVQVAEGRCPVALMADIEAFMAKENDRWA